MANGCKFSTTSHTCKEAPGGARHVWLTGPSPESARLLVRVARGPFPVWCGTFPGEGIHGFLRNAALPFLPRERDVPSKDQTIGASETLIGKWIREVTC